MLRKITIASLLSLLLLPLLSSAQIKLEKRSLLNGKIELLVPIYFKPMTEQMIAAKYPNPVHRADLVLTDDKAEVNIVITLTPQPIQPSQIGKYKDFLMGSLKRAHPDAQWLESGVKIIADKNIGYFKMITNAVDQKVFVYYFFTNIDGKLLILTFNCTEALLPKWKDTADAIVASLRVIK